MIENERQYHVTKKHMAQFEASLPDLRTTPRPANLPPRLHHLRLNCEAFRLGFEAARFQTP
jgi:hypothetical protein